MVVDMTLGSHKRAFLSNVASANAGSPHVFNILISAGHDNGDLVGRSVQWATGEFDVYNEAALGDSAFAGMIQGQDGNGDWIIDVTAVDGKTFLLYNSAISPYPEKKLQDERIMYNKAATVVSGYQLIVGDEFAVSENGFSGKAPAAGKTVTFDASTKKYVVA